MTPLCDEPAQESLYLITTLAALLGVLALAQVLHSIRKAVAALAPSGKEGG